SRRRHTRFSRDWSSDVCSSDLPEKLCIDALEIGEGDVFCDPQPLDLMEHRRVRGVAVDTVRASRGDHLDRGLVGASIAYLHGAGMRAQQQGQAVLVVDVDVERVPHGARGVILWMVQGREVGPVVLDLGAVGNVETTGTEDRLNALPGLN